LKKRTGFSQGFPPTRENDDKNIWKETHALYFKPRVKYRLIFGVSSPLTQRSQSRINHIPPALIAAATMRAARAASNRSRSVPRHAEEDVEDAESTNRSSGSTWTGGDGSDGESSVEDSVGSGAESHYEGNSDGMDVRSDDAAEEHAQIILNMQCCSRECLNQNVSATTAFVRGYMALDKDSQRVSLMTALGTCAAVAVAEPRRDNGQRVRYFYYVPMVGKVCKLAFQAAFNISNVTLTKYVVNIHWTAFV